MSEAHHSNGSEKPALPGHRISVALSDAAKEQSDHLTDHSAHPQMSEELLTPQNLSVELLKTILDAAYFDVSFDSEGDIQVQEEIKCYVVPARDTKDRIGLQAVFGFKPESTDLERLEFVNRVNTEYAIVRASSRQNNTLHYGYDILMAGGITKKAFVLALKRFCTIPRATIREYGQDIVG